MHEHAQLSPGVPSAVSRLLNVRFRNFQCFRRWALINLQENNHFSFFLSWSTSLSGSPEVLGSSATDPDSGSNGGSCTKSTGSQSLVAVPSSEVPPGSTALLLDLLGGVQS